MNKRIFFYIFEHEDNTHKRNSNRLNYNRETQIHNFIKTTFKPHAYDNHALPAFNWAGDVLIDGQDEFIKKIGNRQQTPVDSHKLKLKPRY